MLAFHPLPQTMRQPSLRAFIRTITIQMLMLMLMTVALGLATSALAQAKTATPTVVQVLHTRFVPPEKFERLKRMAKLEGMELRHLDIGGQSPEALLSAVSTASLIVLDGPRPNDRAALTQAFQPVLQQAPDTISVTVGGGRPEWNAREPRVAATLAGLYAAGGEHNFRRFFSIAHTLRDGKQPTPAQLATPQRLPATGFYHPAAPAVFTKASQYMEWNRRRHLQASGKAGQSTGIIAYVIHSSVISDMLTDEVDDLIARTEAAGLTPIVFWQDDGIVAALAGVKPDVLVNLTHLQNGQARKKEFLALGIPVIQTLRFSDGEAAAWPAAASGVSARTTAVFLAVPETWGVSDPLVLSATEDGAERLIPQQADTLIGKLKSLVALRHTPSSQKRVAMMFWNYPAGEKNLSASNLNVPASIVAIQHALSQAGYKTGNNTSHKPGEILDEQRVIATAQRMMAGLRGGDALDKLRADGLAALYPVARYEKWLASLPPARQQELRKAGGDLGKHRAVRSIDGQRYFVIPRWQIGNLVIMPQMPRGADPAAHYHDTKSVPDPLYLAAYLYLQQDFSANALVYLGTHGTQEWLPGKDRGLDAYDYPFLAVGNIPVFYPYIQDNVGEAIQAKRRGRAVVISHQTPPFAPAGLYDQMRDVHQLIHEYAQLDEGNVKEQTARRIREVAAQAHLDTDIGWDKAHAEKDFDTFLQTLHDHLHELARTAMPLGLHTFGQPANAEQRASTVMQQLGEPFYRALSGTFGGPVDELFARDGKKLAESPAYQATRQLLQATDDNALPPNLKPWAQRARDQDRQLQDTQEMESLLTALAGQFVAPGSGGDPVRDPTVRSGRNLYAFEADKLPTQSAYESGAKAYAQLIESFRKSHNGEAPRKLAFSLWSSEAIRHLGVTEAQVLHALGLRPQWDASGRVTALDIIPAKELGRPRVDVVLQVTGVYRDQFDSFLQLLYDAMERLAVLDEPGNAVNTIATNSRNTAAALQKAGMSAADAQTASRQRIFSSAPGEYGTGVPDLAMQSDKWDDDGVIAQQFLRSNNNAYGPRGWTQTPGKANLLAEQLHGVQAAVMSRSSNVHGVLSTDHPFEFLGGLASAVRHLDGQAPQLLISDLRGSQQKTSELSSFLADEMRVRYLNPQWISSMQQEGYAGTLEVLKATNNLFGWQVTDPQSVRADQWQAMFDTYVDDTRKLGTKEWFEKSNPAAQAQLIERMAEAIRKGYWDAPQATREALAQRWQELSQKFGTPAPAEVTRQFIASMAAVAGPGYGLDGTAPSEPSFAQPSNPQAKPEIKPQDQATNTSRTQQVTGQVMQQSQPSAQPVPEPWTRWLTLAALFLALCYGGLRQWRAAPNVFTNKPNSSL